MLSAATLINEIKINPPGKSDNRYMYVELEGTPGASLNNVWFVAFDSGGVPEMVDNLSGFAIGADGLAVIKSSTGGYSLPAATTLIPDDSFFQQSGTSGFSENTMSFYLFSSSNAFAVGTDYDTNNDGVLDHLPTGATALDHVAVIANGSSDLTYGGVVIHNLAGGGTPDAVTRFFGNNSISTSAWFGGELVDTNNVASQLVYDETRPGTNMPNGSFLTPGTLNYPVPAGPTLTSSGNTVTATAGSAAVVIDSAISLNDPESATISSATVTTTGFSEDAYGFTTPPSMSATIVQGQNGQGSFNVITLSGLDTVANYQAALRSITYQDTALSGPTQGTRTLSITVNDGVTTTSTTELVNVAVAPPVVTNGGQSSLNSTAGQTVTADSVVTVSSFDTDVTGAVVSISGNFQTGDAFQFTAQNGITISSNSGGVLTLTGSATPAQYQAALQSITYSSTSTSTLTRTVSFVVKDSNDTGNVNSNTATTTIVVSAPVAISQLYVNGSTWSAFDTYLGAHDYTTGTNQYGFTTAQNIPYGSSTLGFALVTGANQLTQLPWSTINEIDIQFSGALGATPAANSFVITGGTGGAGHAAAAPTVTSVTSLGGNAYQLSLSGSLGYNNYIVSIASTGTVFGPAVTDANGAGISGSWTNGTSTFPSGNGLAGSAFNFMIDVLPGDTSQNGTVNTQDSAKVALLLNDKTTGATSANYVPFVDVTANGTINTQDSAVIALNLNFKSSNITNPTNPAGGLVGGSGFTALALGVQESGQGGSSSTPAVSNVSSPGVSPAVTISVSTGKGSAGSGSAGSSSGSTSTVSSRDHGRHAFAAIDAAASDVDLADPWS